MASDGKIRVGIAGWNFADWRGEFYPKGLPQKQELNYASRALGAIEINSTFYGHQKPESFAAWAADTPEDFRFSVKAHQVITHIKRLKEVEGSLANFFGSGVLALGARLGPFVWQLPPNLSFNAERMETFFALLPQTPEALVALAEKADGVKRPPFTEATGIARVRHAIEVRHKSFADPGFIDLLSRHNIALITADTAEWPNMDVTADFAYLRLQGAPGADHYEETELDLWAERLKALASGERLPGGIFAGAGVGDGKPRDVFAYFVSTDKVHAPRNAMAVMQRLGVEPPK
ncbi:MAG TPA: DUF72 domain-containing protein [Devosiaceae bacterium]|nr:DUF72 domain-containing protein [Devosiaceae bacterium]